MTSQNTVLGTEAHEGQDEAAQRHMAWQRSEAAEGVTALRAGLARLEDFAAGVDQGDTFERAAGDVTQSAMWLLATAMADRPVFTHADPAWTRLAESIQTRADTLRAEARGETSAVTTEPRGISELQLARERIEDLIEERDEARIERDQERTLIESEAIHTLCSADIEDLKGRVRAARRRLAIGLAAAGTVIAILLIAMAIG